MRQPLPLLERDVLGAVVRDTLRLAVLVDVVQVEAFGQHHEVRLDRGELPLAAERIINIAPKGMTQVFFTNSGSEAVDTALKIALAELASLSERRLYRLTTGSLSQRLPPALVGTDRPGLGMIVPQTTAASLVSENKALCWPASADSIPTCEDQEDHVAMSTTAAWRLREVLENSRRVVAIELLCAARALSFRKSEDADVQLGEGARWALPRIEKAAQSPIPSEQIEAIAAEIASGRLEDPCCY